MNDTPAGGIAVVPVRRRGRRRGLVAAMAVSVLLVGYYLVTWYQVHGTGQRNDTRSVDAIVVMGAAQYDGRPSPQLAARLDHALTLWQQQVAPIVVVTGGNLPGDRFTEAAASAAYLVERGVPPTAIRAEDQGRSTYESLVAVRDLLVAEGLGSVVIVSDPFHLLRSRLIADELGLDAGVAATPTTTVTGGDEVRRELKEAAGVALGRLIGFDRLVSITG